jgi:peroxiredoxin Q/BCP
LIPVGEPAPDFAAIDQDGNRVVLSELLKSHLVVLIFYPRDNTPVCTRQLSAVRDDWDAFQRKNAIVLGVNPARTAKHARFAQKHGFPFPLLGDEGSRIAAAYGARGFLFVKRSVYVIRRDGRVALAERGVVPHEKILAALDY